MSRQIIWRRVTIIVLTLVMIFTSFCSLLVGVSEKADVVLADSNARRQALIDFAKKKNLSEMAAGSLLDLSPNDLRMIGVFLSNFYIPWSTSVGVIRDDDEEDLNEAMVNALVEYCNFDKNVAQAVVPIVKQMSEETAERLYIGEFDGDTITGDANIYDGSDTSNTLPDSPGATVLSFFGIASGSFHPMNGGTAPFARSKKFALYWKDGDEKKPVFTSAPARSENSQDAYFSASTIAYALICDTLNYDYGMGGNSIFAVSDFSELESLSASDQELVMVENAPLYVDCFGNIIADLALDHVVILPACANPFTWTDADGENAGKYVNNVNLFMLGEINGGNIRYQEDPGVTGGTNYVETMGQYSYAFDTSSNGLFNRKAWTVYRGNSQTATDTVTGWGPSLASKIFTGSINSEETNSLDAILGQRSWFDDTGTGSSNAMGFPNWATYGNWLGVMADGTSGDFTEFELPSWYEGGLPRDCYKWESDYEAIMATESGDGVSVVYGTNTYYIADEFWYGPLEVQDDSGAACTVYAYFVSLPYYNEAADTVDFGGAHYDIPSTEYSGERRIETLRSIAASWNTWVDMCVTGDHGSRTDISSMGHVFVKMPDDGSNGGFASSLYRGAYQDMLMIDNFQAWGSSNRSDSESGSSSSSSSSSSEATSSSDSSSSADSSSDSSTSTALASNVAMFRLSPSPLMMLGAAVPQTSLLGYPGIIMHVYTTPTTGIPTALSSGATDPVTGQVAPRTMSGEELEDWRKSLMQSVPHYSPVYGRVVPDDVYYGGSSTRMEPALGYYRASEVYRTTYYEPWEAALERFDPGAIANRDGWDATYSPTLDYDRDGDTTLESTGTSAGEYVKVIRLWDSDGRSLTDAVGGKVSSFNRISKVNEVTKLSGSSSAIKPFLVSIYLSYVYAFFDESSGDSATLSWKFNYAGLPEADTSNIDWGDIEIEQDNSELLSLIYYWTHPSKGIKLVSTWFKNKVGGILVDWHEDMAGNASAVSTTGTTRYIGFAGYVTVPALEDLPWTNWLLNMYDSLIIYFIIIMIVIMIGYAMVGSLTFQAALTGVVIFAVCAYIPPRAISTVTNLSNSICDQIYGNKFNYWALVQHEQYNADINAAVAAGTEEEYLQKLFAANAGNADNYATVTVKWMCPKKDNYLVKIEEQVSEETNNTQLMKYIRGMITETVGAESYSEKANALYLYRGYTDIAQYSKYGYSQTKSYAPVSVDASSGMPTINSDPAQLKALGTNKDWQSYINDYFCNEIGSSATKIPVSETYKSAYMSGSIFQYDGVSSGNISAGITANTMTTWRFSSILYNQAFSTAIKNGQGKSMSDFMTLDELDKYPGIKQADTVGLAQVNNGDIRLGGWGDFVIENYTESPYYYFSYNLYDQMAGRASQNGGNPVAFKDLLLGSGETSYFYNEASTANIYGGYGELRDYMDFRSMFYVVIPYLKQCNDVVVEWDETQGLFIYDDISLPDYGAGDVLQIPEAVRTSWEADHNSELCYKYWHNMAVSQLFNMYTPWVDTMYDCDYAKSEKITVLGEEFIVDNPLDPTTYYEMDLAGNIKRGRPMVFCEADMSRYGLTTSDLTQVEQKLIKVNRSVYEKSLQIMDYYTFDPDVLNTAMAMMETFEFNKEFSQTKFIGTDYVMYPQSYELKNFSYDAYLRLILAQSTGESITNGTYTNELGQTVDFYHNLVQNSSILTGIFLIIVDLFACYAIPALKLFFIVAIFFLSIIMIIAASIKLEMKLSKVLMQSLIMPLGKFLGISVGMAFLVSLFMYSGNTSVTNRQDFTITLGDPVMALLVMLLINIAVLILYFKICKKVGQDAVKYTKAVAHSVSGMVGSIGGKITSGFQAGLAGAALVGTAAGIGTLSHGAHAVGSGVRKVRNKLAGRSADDNGGSSVGGDPSTRGAENTATEPKSKPNKATPSTGGKNKYDAKTDEGSSKADIKGSTSDSKSDSNLDLAKNKRKSKNADKNTSKKKLKNMDKAEKEQRRRDWEKKNGPSANSSQNQANKAKKKKNTNKAKSKQVKKSRQANRSKKNSKKKKK